MASNAINAHIESIDITTLVYLKTINNNAIYPTNETLIRIPFTLCFIHKYTSAITDITAIKHIAIFNVSRFVPVDKLLLLETSYLTGILPESINPATP